MAQATKSTKPEAGQNPDATQIMEPMDIMKKGYGFVVRGSYSKKRSCSLDQFWPKTYE